MIETAKKQNDCPEKLAATRVKRENRRESKLRKWLDSGSGRRPDPYYLVAFLREHMEEFAEQWVEQILNGWAHWVYRYRNQPVVNGGYWGEALRLIPEWLGYLIFQQPRPFWIFMVKSGPGIGLLFPSRLSDAYKALAPEERKEWLLRSLELWPENWHITVWMASDVRVELDNDLAQAILYAALKATPKPSADEILVLLAAVRSADKPDSDLLWYLARSS